MSRLLTIVGMTLICATAALSGLLEALYTPLYIGSVIFPVSVACALVVNVLLARLAVSTTGSPVGSLGPIGAWGLVMVVVLSSRPEGDVIVSGSPGPFLVFVATLVVGIVAGVAAGTRS